MKKKILHPKNECYHLLDKYKSTVEEKRNENKGNLLETIIQTQKKFQEDKFGIKFNSNDMKARVAYIREHSHNLQMELDELLDSLPFKSWKDYTKKETRWSLFRDEYSEKEWLEIQYEWVDALHFLVNIGCMLEIDANRAFELYVSKNGENYDRQKRRY